jgi:8-amino-7-oxononanoate synthase
MVFTTGYQANLGAISGLADSHDTVFIDADCHASIYDGCVLSGATVIRFRHNDPQDLDKRLGRLKDKGSNKLVVIEGLYSMIGDRPPLREFAEVKARHNAYLMVDEAHSLGVYGPGGRGLAEAEGVLDDVDFVVGTFSKSLGAIGGFCASNHPKFDFMRLTSHPYMYTASLSPSNVASVLTALRLLQERPELRARLTQNSKALHDGLTDLGYTVCSNDSPIVAVKADSPEEAGIMWNRLMAHGVYVNLAIPPGTPNGVSLLRCSVSAAHTDADIQGVYDAFREVAGETRPEQLASAKAAAKV